MILKIISIFVLLGATAANPKHFLSDEFIEDINSKASTWKAARTFHEKTPHDHIKKLGGTFLDESNNDMKVVRHPETEFTEIPEEFDARVNWPECPTILEIRDQGYCGSCWAFAVTEVISDRTCIHSNGEEHFRASGNHLLACCHLCSIPCIGGYPYMAWLYWYWNGIVSGGPYGSNIGCQPYELPPCEHYVKGPRQACGGNFTWVQCHNTCNNNGYKIPFKQDKHFGRSFYSLDNSTKQIQLEILKNGPVQAAITLFEDFLHYKSGVYKHVTGGSVGGHAIKIIGWGVDNKVPYWLVANSWNTDWGENGFVKILRGSDHLGIESAVKAGIPKPYKIDTS